jgi:hypothetical protein
MIQFSHSIKVYCDGGWHQPLEITLAAGTKQEAVAEVKRRGWKVAADGTTLCPDHPKKRAS